MSIMSDKHTREELEFGTYQAQDKPKKTAVTQNQNITPQRHSDTVGGSTAARVMACPGSVRLCKGIPKTPPSEYAREGSLLHAAIAEVIEQNLDPQEMVGFEHDGMVLTEELLEEKLLPAVKAFDDILDELETEYNDTATIMVEKEVGFGKYIPGAFGSCDILVRVGSRAVVLDWKFGSGVAVSAEDNKQLMFYACAAMRTTETEPIFDEVLDVELVIIQPSQGDPSRWLTTITELVRFEKALKAAVKEADKAEARLLQGKHCRWCAAQPICPLMNGAVDRAVQADLAKIDVTKLGLAVEQSYILEDWIKRLRELVQLALENGTEVPGCKLVAKRGTRKWIDEEKAAVTLSEALTEDELYEKKFRSPAQLEKVLKKEKIDADFTDLVAVVSSGTTLALESDPRPSVNNKVQLVNALNKITKGA